MENQPAVVSSSSEPQSPPGSPPVSEYPGGTPAPESPPHTTSLSERPEARPQTPPSGDSQPVTEPKTPARTAPITQSTPIRPRVSSTYPYNSTTPRIYAEANQKNMFRETHKFFLGPMPVDQFLEAFLPLQDTASSRSTGGIDFQLDKAWSHEKQMYRPLITAIEKLGLSNLRLCVTGSSGDADWIVEDLAPDISAFHSDILAADYRERQLKTAGGKGTADFAVTDLALEVKPKHSHDPFNDPKEGDDLAMHTLVSESKGAQKVLGQMCAYATAQMGMTFRTHCFSVFVAGNTARLIRWDRAGAVVSNSFNYIEEFGLAEFIKRYDLLPQAERGWDQTAIPLALDSPETIEAQDALVKQRFKEETEEEYQERSSYLKKARYFRFLVPDLQATQAAGLEPSVQEARAPDPGTAFPAGQPMDSESPKAYIGPFSTRWACSLLGRSSRGAPVFNPENGQVHWLKDSWRIDMSSIKVEHESYEKMERCGVRNLIPVVAAGDMRVVSPCLAVWTNIGAFSETNLENSSYSAPESTDKVPVRGPAYNSVHCTVTDKLISASWVSGDKAFFWRNMIGYSHNRLVLRDVGRDLTSFPSTLILLQAVADALLCHSDAFFKAEILHRDISPSNILIMDNGPGRLIDWDLSRHGKQGQSHRPGRTGTWQFISGLLLDSPESKVHDYPDDLESFLHTLSYTLVRFSSSSLSGVRLTDFLAMFDEEKYDVDDQAKGGRQKCLNLRSEGSYVEHLDFRDRPGLRGLLESFSGLFCPVYAVKRSEEIEVKVALLKTEQGGGLRIHGMILELIYSAKSSKKWPSDDRSKKTHIRFSVTQKAKRPRNDPIPYQPVSYVSSTLGTSGQEQELGEEGRESKRIRSDAQI